MLRQPEHASMHAAAGRGATSTLRNALPSVRRETQPVVPERPRGARPEQSMAWSTVMLNDVWASVAAYSDRMSAEAIVGLLAGQQMPCYIASNEHIPGLGSSFSVCVPARLRHRAQWILEQARVTESELTELAMRCPADGSADQ
jgi:hypothetical protein